MGNWSALWQMTRVRVLLFLREPEAVFWVFVFPIVLALVLGWAFSDPKAASVPVGSFATAGQSASLDERLSTEERLEVRQFDDLVEARRALKLGKISALVIAAASDSAAAETTRQPSVEYDPDRPEGELARLYIERSLRQPPEGEAEDGAELTPVSGTGSRYIDWLFPGLLGMNIMGTGIWGIGFTLAEWRQKKLIRRFLVTPMRRSSFLLAFVFSRFIYLVLEVVVLTSFAVWALGVPILGSIFSYGLLCALAGLTFSALGILISSRTRTIEGVSGLMNLVMMPMWLFSGIFFSYERFPEVIHPFIRMLPLTAFNDGLRGIMLEGATLASLWPQMLNLSIWSVLVFLVSLKIFRWE